MPGTNPGMTVRAGGAKLALLVAAGSVPAFAGLTIAVLGGHTAPFDSTVLLALRNPANLSDPIGPARLGDAARDITSLGGYPVLTLVTTAAVLYLALAGKKGAALMVVVSVCGGMLISSVLKELFARARPDLVPHTVEVVTASYPSGHAMLSAVAYLTLGALLARVEPRGRIRAYLVAVAVVLTLLVGASRVYLGVHWPTDVLAGWCVGVTWSTLCWLATLRLQRQGVVEEAAP